MLQFAICLAGAFFLFSACGHRAQPNPAIAADSSSRADSAGQDFFPVAEVLESEIRTVDSTPMAIKEYSFSGGKTDSSFLKPVQFEALARQFLVPEFRDGSFERDFTENSFIDNATQDATFTYSTGNKDLPLQRVDIIASPKGAVHMMKSVYLERSRVSGDSSILEKMYWRAGKGFEVIRLVHVKGGAPTEQREKVVWDGSGENE
ncbi:MAG TPA: hypothetical protein VKU83_05535 [Puia sp.]|nr:hypothetical protein [Puia sp.]